MGIYAFFLKKTGPTGEQLHVVLIRKGKAKWRQHYPNDKARNGHTHMAYPPYKLTRIHDIPMKIK